MIFLGLAAGATQAGQIENLPYKFPDMLFPGEREVVVGALPYKDTTMPVYHTKESYQTKPSGTFGGPNWEEYSLGTVRWSVKPGNFGQKPCMIVHEEGLYTPTTTYVFNRFKKITNTVAVRGILEWYVDMDGTILRQFQAQADPRGVQSATCTYDKDSINVQLEQFGKRSVTTLYPADMDKLQAQFRPMIVNGKVVMTDKEFLVFDPFSGGFSKRKAHFGGHFSGNYLNLNFHGVDVDMEGIRPEGPMKVYVDDEGDLVQIDLANDCYVKLGVAPPGKAKQ